MAWTDLAPQLDKLMQKTLKHVEAPEIFNIQLVPATKADRVYCLMCDGFSGDSKQYYDRIRPFVTVRISTMYELGLNVPANREAAIAEVENIVKTMINPVNRPANTVLIRFKGTRSRLFKDSGFWIIFDTIFETQYDLLFPTT